MEAKEALYIIIDVSERMRPHLKDALEAVRMTVNAKLLFHPRDVIGLALHSTEVTENHMAAEMGEGQYQNICEIHTMAPVSYKTLQALDQVMTAYEPGGPADMIDSLVVGTMAVKDYVKKLKFGKRVLFVTDGTSPAALEDEELAEIAQQLKDSQIKFEVFGIGMDALDTTANDEDEDADDIAAARASTQRVLEALEEALGKEYFSHSPVDSLSIVGALKKRSVRSNSCFRGPLAIGQVALPVWSWKKVSPATAPKMISVSKAALNDPAVADNPVNTVSTERRYYMQAAPDEDVPPNLHIPGYRFGKDLIPVSGADAEKIKFTVDVRSLQLIGLIKQEDIGRHLLTGRPEWVVPEPDSLGGDGNKALQALVLAMEELGFIGIARYAPRKGSMPGLVSLWPKMTCFQMLNIPFAEEVKQFDWASPSEAHVPSQSQLEAAGSLINAMELTTPSATEGVKAKEALRPKDVFSPKLQRMYQCIQHRARAVIEAASDGEGLSSTLPEPDVQSTRALTQDPRLLQRASEVRVRAWSLQLAIDDFAAACPLQPAIGASAASKRSRYGDPSSAETEAAKRQKMLMDDKVGVSGGGAFLQIGHDPMPASIRSDNPTGDFWRIVSDMTEDRVDVAMQQMSEVIPKLLQEANASHKPACHPMPPHDPRSHLATVSHALQTPSLALHPEQAGADPKDPHAEKAFRALREMRVGAVQEDAPAAFNRTMHELRDTYRDGPSGPGAIWTQIRADLACKGLITDSESPGTNGAVSNEVAASFWNEVTAIAPVVESAAPGQGVHGPVARLLFCPSIWHSHIRPPHFLRIVRLLLTHSAHRHSLLEADLDEVAEEPDMDDLM